MCLLYVCTCMHTYIIWSMNLARMFHRTDKCIFTKNRFNVESSGQSQCSKPATPQRKAIVFLIHILKKTLYYTNQHLHFLVLSFHINALGWECSTFFWLQVWQIFPDYLKENMTLYNKERRIFRLVTASTILLLLRTWYFVILIIMLCIHCEVDDIAYLPHMTRLAP